MYKHLLTVGFIVLLWGDNWAQQGDVLYTTEKFSSSHIKKVDVSTSGGQITISGQAGDEASVEVLLRRNGRNQSHAQDEVKALFEKEYDLTVATRNGTLIVKAERKSRLRRGDNALSVSFNIKVPSKVDTKLLTGGGSIKIDRLEGHLAFKTGGGSLYLNALRGVIDGESGGGSITVSDSEGTIGMVTGGGSIKLNDLSGSINIRTGGGSIKGSQLAGTLTTRTGGGSIQLTDLACELDVNTGGGSIAAWLKEASNPISLKTGAGSIDVVLPADKGYDVDLRGSRVNTKNLRNFSGSQKKKEMKGQVNGGGIALAASTGSGTITVSFQ